ncbi:hypothetical protein CR205_03535 [Alteribacter lacisalsi]|uniref:Damage-inducible protein DinB n=1 Tax=Alteribacter lacisalsi TaxID=2045244 RepID=A0A2W0HVG6_9BACI|nr:DinB family protein [Alteribacter lacisalsi]PYZ97678.1 hypothetical protein CR205_03535 [Alteribacter lacisalsi]
MTLIDLFMYNWQVREDWFRWCEQLPPEELTKHRNGGMNSILHNLFHVISCEELWVCLMQNKPVPARQMREVKTLVEVKTYSEEIKAKTKVFMSSFEPGRTLERTRRNGETISLSHGKVVRHIITHEVHHIGQISVWARDMGLKPVSTDLVFREYES